MESARRKFIIELEQRCFFERHVNWKVQVGPLNSLLQHYGIFIATGKRLSSYREDLPKLGKTPTQECKKPTSG